MSVIIRCDTGFVGGIHEEDTGMTVEEWKALDDKAKEEYFQGIIEDNIEVYACDGDLDEDDEDVVLD